MEQIWAGRSLSLLGITPIPTIDYELIDMLSMLSANDDKGALPSSLIFSSVSAHLCECI